MPLLQAAECSKLVNRLAKSRPKCPGRAERRGRKVKMRPYFPGSGFAGLSNPPNPVVILSFLAK
jgi:hypothetical protein